jgi:hypothetical protein
VVAETGSHGSLNLVVRVGVEWRQRCTSPTAARDGLIGWALSWISLARLPIEMAVSATMTQKDTWKDEGPRGVNLAWCLWRSYLSVLELRPLRVRSFNFGDGNLVAQLTRFASACVRSGRASIKCTHRSPHPMR